MLTNNYYNAWLACMTGKSCSLKCTNGSSGSTRWDSNYTPKELAFCLATSSISDLAFGNGTAAESRDDYKLSGSSLSVTIQSTNSTVELLENGARATKVLFVSNPGTEEITISEVGWIGSFTTSSSMTTDFAMLDRTLLAKPLTLPPGGAGQINYVIHLKFPT